ncbi:DUF3581 domain-containing protein [Reinekea sp.]|uniref:DUF3581 domain-containing protein n=1 Tax=Reinekea sp. TaxID=1970455 RepID=UPI0039891ED5
MFLDEFHTVSDDKIIISAEQASRFAKEVAGDFNPIHDPDAKRFCVPGDLLFAITLSKYGLSQNMAVSFSGMVGRDLPIVMPTKADEAIELKDENGKLYTTIEHSGDVSHNESLISAFIRNYVEFSGQNFPFILVPLLDKHQVMFNPKRPLVIYESMSFNLDTLDIAQPNLELVDSTLEVNGKRGDVHFIFAIKDGDKVVGKGDKKLIVSGIQPFDKVVMDEVVTNFNELKAAYRPA